MLHVLLNRAIYNLINASWDLRDAQTWIPNKSTAKDIANDLDILLLKVKRLKDETK
jgi:hypothetical protein